MRQPAVLSAMQKNRATVAAELRRLLPKIEGFASPKTLPFGLSAVDRHLPQGGLACGAPPGHLMGAGGGVAFGRACRRRRRHRQARSEIEPKAAARRGRCWPAALS